MTILNERGEFQSDTTRAYASIPYQRAYSGIGLLGLCKCTGPRSESKRGQHTQTITT